MAPTRQQYPIGLQAAAVHRDNQEAKQDAKRLDKLCHICIRWVCRTQVSAVIALWHRSLLQHLRPSLALPSQAKPDGRPKFTASATSTPVHVVVWSSRSASVRHPGSAATTHPAPRTMGQLRCRRGLLQIETARCKKS
jgi:hypothetical protein